MSRYPFTSRREVADRLTKDADFVRDCVRLLQERTLAKTGGFMASHRSKAVALLGELDTLSDETVLARASWIASYARTLARIEREARLRADPSVAASAAVFGIAPETTVKPTPTVAIESRAPVAPPGDGETADQPVAIPKLPHSTKKMKADGSGIPEPAKRRGRPTGSKNRKRDLEATPARRSRA